MIHGIPLAFRTPSGGPGRLPSAPRRAARRAARAAAVAVEPIEPRVLFSVFTVTSAADSGAGSLRQAILNSNATPGVRDTIRFAIGTGQKTISPASALPVVTDPVVIDASTQPGANGRPGIVLSGASAGASANGLVLAGGNSVVKGFVVNAFGGNGIVIQSHDGDVIIGNYIGLNAAGSAAAPDGGDGLLDIGRGFNQIGGPSAAERNVISGNGSKASFPTLARDGIHLKGPGADHNLVENNYLGTDATGTVAVGNSKFGLELDGAAGNNVVGNLVSANTAGVEIDNGGNHNTVQHNTIGTRIDGVTPLGNTLHGVVFGVGQGNDHNLIGGATAGAGNLISGNGTAGIAVFGLTSNGRFNSFLGNSIFNNGRSNPTFLLGIDLVPTKAFPVDDGVTANATTPGNAGPNDLQNHPVLLAAHVSGSTVFITGAIQAAANQTYRIEFFSNASPSPDANVEGQLFIGAASVTTNASGQSFFNVKLNASLGAGPLVTATATSASGDTSEFSAAILAG